MAGCMSSWKRWIHLNGHKKFHDSGNANKYMILVILIQLFPWIKALSQQMGWYLACLVYCLSASLCEQILPTVIYGHDITCTII